MNLMPLMGRGSYGLLEKTGNAAVACIVIAIIATVVLYVVFLPKSKRKNYSGFVLWLYDFLSMKTLILEPILKCLYVFSTVLAVLVGIVLLFSNFIEGLLTIILFPFVIRIAYEAAMYLFTLVRNVIEINNYLHGVENKDNSEALEKFSEVMTKGAKAAASAAVNAASNIAAAAENSSTEKNESKQEETTEAKKCPNCGEVATGKFCRKCGTKID